MVQCKGVGNGGKAVAERRANCSSCCCFDELAVAGVGMGQAKRRRGGGILQQPCMLATCPASYSAGTFQQCSLKGKRSLGPEARAFAGGVGQAKQGGLCSIW
jgi:hypothetical protein